MAKLFKIFAKRWYLILMTALAIICQVWFQLNLPDFMGNIQTIIMYGKMPVIQPVTYTNPLTGEVLQIIQTLSQEEMISRILNQGGWMILCCAVILCCAFIQFYGASSTGAYTGKELRRYMYQKVNTLSLSEYNKFGTATLITRTTNDIEQIKNYVIMALRIMVMSPTYMIIAIIKTVTLPDPGPRLSLVLVIAIPLIIAFMVIIFAFVVPLFKLMQYRLDDVTVVLREGLTGVRVIRAYDQQETESKKFKDVNGALRKIQKRSGRIMSIANPAIQVIFNFTFIVIYAFGFYLLTDISGVNINAALAEQVKIISIVAQYSMQIMNSFLMFAMILIMIPQALASYRRIDEVFQTKSIIDDSYARDFAKKAYEAHLARLEYRFKEEYKNTHDGNIFSFSLLKDKFSKMSEEEKVNDPLYKDYTDYIDIRKNREKIIERLNDNSSDEYIKVIEKYFHDFKEHGVVEFKNVSFTYPDANTPTIMNISFKTKPGTTTAIIGSTGSGKSTLINLIPRFYDATEGEILFDGVNVKFLPQKVLRDHVGFVPQQAVLFSGSIRENMKYGDKEASDETIITALNVAQAGNFVSKLPEKLDTYVSQGGKNFSGGQKQRLCIARALVRKPEIYVFDDSFSALDFKTDAMLRAELKKYTKNASTIVVAQRVSSILDADNIIVLNEGKCVGQGTHRELLASCKVYQDIVKSQLDPEEVEKTIQLTKQYVAEGGNK